MTGIRVGDYVEARGIVYDEECEMAGYVTKIDRGRLYLTSEEGELDSCFESQVYRVKPLTAEEKPSPFAFEVPEHRFMYLRLPGKRAETVLALEQQIHSVRISEYVEPLFFDRAWCYETFGMAMTALMRYVRDEEDEPQGWLRAVTPDGVRRRQTVEGS